jgi:hypothetical protein
LQFGGSSVNNATNNPKVKAMIVEKMIGMCWSIMQSSIIPFMNE